MRFSLKLTSSMRFPLFKEDTKICWSCLNSRNLIEDVCFKEDLIPWLITPIPPMLGNEVFFETHIFNEISAVQRGHKDMAKRVFD